MFRRWVQSPVWLRSGKTDDLHPPRCCVLSRQEIAGVAADGVFDNRDSNRSVLPAVPSASSRVRRDAQRVAVDSAVTISPDEPQQPFRQAKAAPAIL
jgi:hypothetical protein